MSEDSDVEFFRRLLKFRTISADGPKNGEYRACVNWLRLECDKLGLSTQIVEPVAEKPVLIATLEGIEKDIPSVVLNSHYDVVPAIQDHWDVDPWAAVKKEGRIYGRGAQDMKCVLASYILALKRVLVARVGQPFRRSLHLIFVPDEELGGKDGMDAFLKTAEFQALGTIGVALDEGLASPEPQTTVFYGERAPMWILVHADGATGHGSRFIADTAVEKLIGLSHKALQFRALQEKKLGHSGGCAHCQSKKLGDVMSLNLTMLDAGVTLDGGKTYALNVIPTEARAGFDIRVPPSTPIEQVKAMLDEWCTAEGLTWEFASWTKPIDEHHVTSTEIAENPWWGVFEAACASAGLEIRAEIFPASTDSRFLRKLGIPAFGFSPLPNTPVLLHEHNEYVDQAVFLSGIKAYESIIPALCNASGFSQKRRNTIGKESGKDTRGTLVRARMTQNFT